LVGIHLVRFKSLPTIYTLGGHTMSYYDNDEKDYLKQEIDNFLEHHTISEFLKIVYDCVRDRDNEDVAD